MAKKTGDSGGTTQRFLRRIRSITAPKDLPQLRELLKETQREGLIDADALSMIEGVLDVTDLQVRDIMVPHNQMICVSIEDPPRHMLQTAIDSGHSRFPVQGPDGEGVVGILLAKDLLRLQAQERDANWDLRAWLRKAVFVPESKRVNVLLKELRMGRNHMAIAVDEYGNVAGLVTIEDVIEQIVGEIDDEYDFDEDHDNIIDEANGKFRVKARTEVIDFNEHFETGFGDDEFDTIGGLVLRAFGRLPKRGEAVTMEGMRFRVLRADSRRLHTLQVERIAPPAVEVDA